MASDYSRYVVVRVINDISVQQGQRKDLIGPQRDVEVLCVISMYRHGLSMTDWEFLGYCLRRNSHHTIMPKILRSFEVPSTTSHSIEFPLMCPG